MSEFSELLSYWINAKEIKVHSLVQYCGLDRSTIYKIIRGSRLPASPELLDKMIGFLELTPAEASALREAWLISSIGRVTYRKRKNVQDFLLYFFELQNAAPVFSSAKVSSNLDSDTGSTPLFLNGQTQLNNMVHFALAKEFEKPDGYLRLIVQPDYSFLFDILTSLGQNSYSASPEKILKIEHILCLDNKDTVMPGTDWDYNISCVKTLLPLHACLREYLPYYYYDDVNSHFSDLSLMPCLVLTGDCAIVFSADFHQGIFFHSPDAVKHFSALFQKQLSASKPLTRQLSDTEADTGSLKPIPSSLSFFILQAEPCLRAFMEPKHIETYLNPQIPNRADTAAQLSEALYTQNNMDSLGNTVMAFTADGIKNFLSTGTVSELPDGFFEPFSMEDRYSIINKMYPSVLDGRCRMLTGSFAKFPSEAHVTISPRHLDLLFPDYYGKLHLLRLQEPGLTSAFFDFMEHGEDAGIWRPQTEAAEFLLSLLASQPV